MTMRLTQGQFSFLPDLTEEQIKKQVQYALDHGWPISIEYTDDPHPRNSYWEMHGLPMFDPNSYVKVNAYDARLGRQTTAMSFIVGRPANEPGFRLDRTEWSDRQIKYSVHSYAVEEPAGERYKK
jgi:ribulose-bisphosphate carboxylase small chain